MIDFLNNLSLQNNQEKWYLDFPLEILIQIFKESDRSLELKYLHSYINNIYNQYKEFKFIILNLNLKGLITLVNTKNRISICH